METIPQSILFIGIIPALILLYISLKGYDDVYREKTVFLMFIIGIILGVITAVIEIFTLKAGILIIALFPVLEQIVKTMVLNIGRLQRKRETTIYGLVLGLGFGSVFTPISMIMGNISSSDITLILLVVVGSFGIIMFHGGTGVLIGYGIYKGELLKYYLIAVLVDIPLVGWFFITGYLYMERFQVGLIFYGLIVYWYATKKVMPRILSENLKRKRSN